MMKYLPEEEVLLEIPEEQRFCSKCGGKMKPIEKWDRQNINLYIISFTEIEGRSKREKRYAGLDSDLRFHGKRRKPAGVAPAVLAELY